MVRLLTWLAVWMTPVVPPAAARDAGELVDVVDEVVAVVNRHVITRSEVWDEAVLILVDRRGETGLGHRITPTFLKKVLEMLINQRVLLDEARRIGLPLVTDHERGHLLEGFRRRFTGREAWTRFLLEHGMTEDTVAEALVRHYRIERLKENKLRVMPEVTDEQVRAYFEKHRLDFGGASYGDVAGAIRLRLSRQQQETELARWISELGKRSEVKVLVDMVGIAKGNLRGG